MGADHPFGGEGGEGHDGHEGGGGEEAVGGGDEVVFDEHPGAPDEEGVGGSGADGVEPVFGEEVDGRMVGANFQTDEKEG